MSQIMMIIYWMEESKIKNTSLNKSVQSAVHTILLILQKIKIDLLLNNSTIVKNNSKWIIKFKD